MFLTIKSLCFNSMHYAQKKITCILHRSQISANSNENDVTTFRLYLIYLEISRKFTTLVTTETVTQTTGCLTN